MRQQGRQRLKNPRACWTIAGIIYGEGWPRFRIMPRAFLSYSHDDAAFAAELEEQLRAVGWDVWRDVQSLRAGDRWPRKLGDAIASFEAFVLVWSAHAARSDVVEHEWTIAVAKKRLICILTLDREPLPPTLCPYQVHQASQANTAARWLSNVTLENPTGEAEPGRNSRKSLYIVAVVIILIGMIVIAAVIYRQYTASPSTEQQAVMQPFGGFVQDEQGLPLEGVTLMAPTQNITVVTDRIGHFSFQVRLPANTNFRLVASKPGYEVRTADPPAGDTTFNCTLIKSAKPR